MFATRTGFCFYRGLNEELSSFTDWDGRQPDSFPLEKNDIIMLGLDLDNRILGLCKNGVFLGIIMIGLKGIILLGRIITIFYKSNMCRFCVYSNGIGC